ncbi:MAG: protein-L-isoaspartate(D-aspartate) O-methyltransferase [Xanthomonadaceae bacterium]|nr:protein-L-isoaspartate(D-aspartate) O-methyltransferase [Xanthomonadaceae bacterium]MBU6477775.1 protein-L-isoaspartate(D-aspartate) O-methyltransferase [Xanthomonadaceae bacterium]MDE2053375.1 protein-L-isoaspartate(D-aspartate) O-methyltransferase [Xanthomonadaceae bacterium]MDE2496460.1 protein-L-isoaspartate(D-aspartate) O-methyltransferase [Xanthomonadaceae bacterium]
MNTLYGTAAVSARGHGMTSQRARDRLVATLRDEGIKDPRVLDVIRTMPRHLFLDEALSARAYENNALPIGLGQTISQPWVVARMTELLIEQGTPKRVLEIGTGSGYQAAVLAQLVDTVYTIERIEELLRKARRLFRNMKIGNIRSRHDDGNIGWPGEAPFDAIVLTAAGESMPRALQDQLAEGGVMVAPLGPAGSQRLMRFRREGDVLHKEELEPVSFVPLLGGLV